MKSEVRKKLVTVPPEIWAKDGKWRIYAIVVQVKDDTFVVKIGVSSHIAVRMSCLRSGMPFRPSALLFSPGIKKKACMRIEANIHRKLARFRTYGEWFLFEIGEKSSFHDCVFREWWKESDVQFKWSSLPWDVVEKTFALILREKHRYARDSAY